MTIDELIQLMRTASLHEFRKALEKVQKSDHSFYEKLITLYQRSQKKP